MNDFVARFRALTMLHNPSHPAHSRTHINFYDPAVSDEVIESLPHVLVYPKSRAGGADGGDDGANLQGREKGAGGGSSNSNSNVAPLTGVGNNATPTALAVAAVAQEMVADVLARQQHLEWQQQQQQQPQMGSLGLSPRPSALQTPQPRSVQTTPRTPAHESGNVIGNANGNGLMNLSGVAAAGSSSSASSSVFGLPPLVPTPTASGHNTPRPSTAASGSLNGALNPSALTTTASGGAAGARSCLFPTHLGASTSVAAAASSGGGSAASGTQSGSQSAAHSAFATPIHTSMRAPPVSSPSPLPTIHGGLTLNSTLQMSSTAGAAVGNGGLTFSDNAASSSSAAGSVNSSMVMMNFNNVSGTTSGVSSVIHSAQPSPRSAAAQGQSQFQQAQAYAQAAAAAQNPALMPVPRSTVFSNPHMVSNGSEDAQFKQRWILFRPGVFRFLRRVIALSRALQAKHNHLDDASDSDSDAGSDVGDDDDDDDDDGNNVANGGDVSVTGYLSNVDIRSGSAGMGGVGLALDPEDPAGHGGLTHRMLSPVVTKSGGGGGSGADGKESSRSGSGSGSGNSGSKKAKSARRRATSSTSNSSTARSNNKQLRGTIKLAVFTLSSQHYAAAIIDMIERRLGVPSGSLFETRVIARESNHQPEQTVLYTIPPEGVMRYLAEQSGDGETASAIFSQQLASPLGSPVNVAGLGSTVLTTRTNAVLDMCIEYVHQRCSHHEIAGRLNLVYGRLAQGFYGDPRNPSLRPVRPFTYTRTQPGPEGDREIAAAVAKDRVFDVVDAELVRLIYACGGLRAAPVLQEALSETLLTTHDLLCRKHAKILGSVISASREQGLRFALTTLQKGLRANGLPPHRCLILDDNRDSIWNPVESVNNLIKMPQFMPFPQGMFTQADLPRLVLKAVTQQESLGVCPLESEFEPIFACLQFIAESSEVLRSTDCHQCARRIVRRRAASDSVSNTISNTGGANASASAASAVAGGSSITPRIGGGGLSTCESDDAFAVTAAAKHAIATSKTKAQLQQQLSPRSHPYYYFAAPNSSSSASNSNNTSVLTGAASTAPPSANLSQALGLPPTPRRSVANSQVCHLCALTPHNSLRFTMNP